MLKYSLPATALLVVGLTACLDDPAGPQCQTYENEPVETRGDTIVTEIGLRYIELAPGTSQLTARWCAEADVHYTGTLLDGTEFDSSQGGAPYTFTPGSDNTIVGFVFGVVGMQVGERRRLIIPPNLGYGSQGSPPDIPPNATIIFDVQLVSTD
jgi:FKBP-type peptidyl-prolyl cis-trans isomerase